MSPLIAAGLSLNDLLEKDWQAQVVSLARTLGWAMIYHTHDSRRSAHGMPDLLLVRDRILFLELKREHGKLTPEQRHWLQALRTAGAEAYVARPRQLDELAAVLTRPGAHGPLDAATAAELGGG